MWALVDAHLGAVALDAALADDEVGIGAGLVEGDEVGVGDEEAVAVDVGVVEVGPVEHGVVELAVAVAQGVDSEVPVVEVPSEETGILVVAEGHTGGDGVDGAVGLQLVERESVVVVDVVEVDGEDLAAAGEVVDEVGVGEDLVEVADEGVAVVVFQRAEPGDVVGRELVVATVLALEVVVEGGELIEAAALLGGEEILCHREALVESQKCFFHIDKIFNCLSYNKILSTFSLTLLLKKLYAEGVSVSLADGADACGSDLAAADAGEVVRKHGEVAADPQAVAAGEPPFGHLVEQIYRLVHVEGHLDGPGSSAFYYAVLDASDGEDGVGKFHPAPVARQQVHIAFRTAVERLVGQQHMLDALVEVGLGDLDVAVGGTAPMPVVTRDDAEGFSLTHPLVVGAQGAAGMLDVVLIHNIRNSYLLMFLSGMEPKPGFLPTAAIICTLLLSNQLFNNF